MISSVKISSIDGLFDGPVETNQKLAERFLATPNQHCKAAILIGSDGDTADGLKHTEPELRRISSTQNYRGDQNHCDGDERVFVSKS